jgi:hypothetical protein
VQREFRAMYASDRARVDEFINRLFNNINLALSELTVAIDEVLSCLSCTWLIRDRFSRTATEPTRHRRSSPSASSWSSTRPRIHYCA